MIPTLVCAYLPSYMHGSNLTWLPYILASPLSGWITDRYGPEWTLSISFLLIIPWLGLLTVNGPLAFFIAMFCLESERQFCMRTAFRSLC